MSMPPRSRTGSGPLLAGLIIAAVVVVAIVVLAASGATPASVWNSFFPNHGTGGVTDRSTSVQDLYDFVFYIAVAIFLLVEGLIVWSVFRYRRKSTDTDLPPQTHGNNLVEVIWTVIPTAIVLVLFAMSWQSLNTVDAKVPTDVTVRADRGPVPVVVRLPRRPAARRRRRCSPWPCRSATRAAWSSRSASPCTSSCGPTTSSTRSTSRSSCSSGTSCRGAPTRSTSRSRRPGTYRGQCAELCGAFHGSMLFDVHAVARADYDAWLADQIAKANATPPPAPSGEAAGPVVQLDGPEHRVHGDRRSRRRPTRRSRSTSATTTTRVPHNVDIKDANGGAVVPGRHLQRRRRDGLRGSAACRRHVSLSSAPFTRT